MIMSVSTPDSILEKAVLAISKLQGCDDWYLWSTMICVALGHTWAYVDGDKAQAPTTTDDKYVPWLVEDWNAHQRMFLALSDDVKQTILMHANSTASALFSALKDQYECMGVCVCSHLLPCSHMIMQQCSSPLSTWDTKDSSYMVRDSLESGEKSSGGWVWSVCGRIGV